MLKIKTRKLHSGPMVTVGMPVYNGEKYLAEAIESVLEQDFQDLLSLRETARNTSMRNNMEIENALMRCYLSS